MNFKKYHVSKNLCPVSGFTKTTERYYEVHLTKPLSAGTYTISAEITPDVGVTECRISFRKSDGTQDVGQNVIVSSGRSVLTIELYNDCHFIYFYGTESASIIAPVTYNNIMLNTGSTALPYEPYSSEVWHDIPYYIHNTSTDTITTLPAVLYPTGSTATVGLKGNTAQSGTPSPQNPAMPNGTGEKTGNLWGVPIVQGAVSDTGDLLDLSTRVRGEYIPIQPETQYTISCNKIVRCIYAYYNQVKVSQVVRNTEQITKITFTTPASCNSICVGFMNSSPTTDITPSDIEYVMLNSGSTALPYEPFGFKIPISSASITTPVYLGEVQTTRKVKKLVLTGEETGWTKSGTYQGSFFAQVLTNININAQTDPVMHAVCSHAQIVRFGNFVSGTATLTGSTTTKSINLWIGEPEWTVDDFEAYLAQQYAAGTPVTVWYVLTEPETGIVNEPLMKIGDYADEVSNISIPVAAGGDTLSVGTTVQPSEVTANYHGWHNGAVKDYENGDWQPQVQALSLSNAPMLSNSLMAFPDMSEPEIEPETTE